MGQLGIWWGGRVVEGVGLENQRPRKGSGGSNPFPTVSFFEISTVWSGARVAEGARLLSVCMGNRIESSNLFLSVPLLLRPSKS